MNLLLGTHWLSILSLLGTAAAFSFVSFCVLRTWLGTCQVWAPKIWLFRNAACTPFAPVVLLAVASSQENCLSLFWLSLRVPLDLGRVISVAPFLRTPLKSKGLFNMVRSIYSLSQLKPDKTFKRIVFNVALWSEGGHIEN